MTMMKRGLRMARGAVLGVLAIGAAMLMLPGTAGAGSSPHKIARQIERIAYKADRIPDIRGLYRKDAAIDRLQSRLRRLERVTDHQRGRRAQRNGRIIDRLQHRLRRMERRIEAKIERREARRGYRGGHRSDNRSDHRGGRRSGYWGYRSGYWGTGSPVIIVPGFN